MKVFKSEKDKYGWRLRIHLLKDNCLRIWREKKGSENNREIDIWEEDEIKFLEEALSERRKQINGETKNAKKTI